MVTTVMQSPHFKDFFAKAEQGGRPTQKRVHHEHALSCKLQLLCREGRKVQNLVPTLTLWCPY